MALEVADHADLMIEDVVDLRGEGHGKPGEGALSVQPAADRLEVARNALRGEGPCEGHVVQGVAVPGEDILQWAQMLGLGRVIDVGKG